MPNKKILIVDDSHSILEIIKLSIEHLCPGCTVTVAANGFSALKQLQQESFDLVLTDYDMPRMNGLDMARVIRRQWPDTCIVLMSASTLHEGIQTQAAPLNLDGYLQKPFRLELLSDILHNRILSEAVAA